MAFARYMAASAWAMRFWAVVASRGVEADPDADADAQGASVDVELLGEGLGQIVDDQCGCAGPVAGEVDQQDHELVPAVAGSEVLTAQPGP